VIGQSERLPWTREEQEAYADLAAWFMNRFKGQILGVADQSASGYIRHSQSSETEVMAPLPEMDKALEAAIGPSRFWLRVFPEFAKGINDDGTPYARCYCRLYVVDRPETTCSDDVTFDVLLGSAVAGGSGELHWELRGAMSRNGTVFPPLPDGKFINAKRIGPHRWLITVQEADAQPGVTQEWELVASYVGLSPRFYRVK